MAGPLTIVGSATIFTWGLYELTEIGDACYSDCFNPVQASALLAGAGAGMILGTTLTVLGARQRRRYLDWRVARGRPIELRPVGSASPRGFSLGVHGRF